MIPLNSKLIFFFHVLFFAVIGKSQCLSFEKTISYLGNQVAVRDFQTTSDGGYILCADGSGFAPTNWLMFVTKIDHSGNLLWTKSFCLPLQTNANSVCETGDHGYLVSCVQLINTGNNSFANLIRLDSIGDTLWTKKIENTSIIHEEIYRIRPTHDGGFIGIGMTSGAMGNEMMAVKLDAASNIQWYYHLVNEWAMPSDVIETSDHCFILAGNCSDPTTFLNDPLMVKLDSTGQQLWIKAYSTGANINRQLSCVFETNNGEIIFGGVADQLLSTNSLRDNLLIRTDASGNILSAIGLGTMGNDIISSCTIDPSGIIYGTGSSSAFNTGFLFSISINGQVNAEKFGEPSLNESPSFLIHHPWGEIAIAGNCYSNGTYSIWINRSLCDGTTFCSTDTLTLISNDVSSLFFSYLPSGSIANSGISSMQGADTLPVVFATDSIICITLGENENILSNNLFQIFPNPVHSNRKISIESKDLFDNFQLFDISGRNVFSTCDKNGLREINLPELSPGLYMFYLKDIKGNQNCGKIILID